VICRSCGALLHVGLRHECSGGSIEEGLRRVRRAQRAQETFAAAGLGDPIRQPGPYAANVAANLADLLNAPRPPIRVTATVGPALACRVSGCTLHNPPE
jgi:hypothetical protein